jgi:hypothetical protein
LWTDDSLLEAADKRPDDEFLQRLAVIQRLARERGHGRHDVSWFGRVIRERMVEQEEARVAERAKPHPIEVVETREGDERVIVARNPGVEEPVMVLRTASLCPDCVSTALRAVLEQYEADARG